MTDILETIREMVVGGKFNDIEEQVQRAVDSGTDLNLLINDALISAMDIVGKRFADGDIYVPEMLVSAKTMKQGLDIIKLPANHHLSDCFKNVCHFWIPPIGFEADDTLSSALSKVRSI